MPPLALAGTDARRGLDAAPHVVLGKMHGESCVVNRAKAKPLFIYWQGRFRVASDLHRRNENPPRLGREGKLELTEALRSQDRS